jgi:hypothetical protein
MTTRADDVQRSKPRGGCAPGSPESLASERALIQKSMRRWEEIDTLGREMGRGLGRKELIERVAREVGTTLSSVHSALKSAKGERDGQ